MAFGLFCVICYLNNLNTFIQNITISPHYLSGFQTSNTFSYICGNIFKNTIPIILPVCCVHDNISDICCVSFQTSDGLVSHCLHVVLILVCYRKVHIQNDWGLKMKSRDNPLSNRTFHRNHLICHILNII